MCENTTKYKHIEYLLYAYAYDSQLGRPAEICEYERNFRKRALENIFSNIVI